MQSHKTTLFFFNLIVGKANHSQAHKVQIISKNISSEKYTVTFYGSVHVANLGKMQNEDLS